MSESNTGTYPRRPGHHRAHSRAASVKRSISFARVVKNQPRKRLAIAFFLFGVLVCSLFNFVGVAAAADLVGQAASPGVVLFAYTAPSIFVRLVIPYLPNVTPEWLSPTYIIRLLFPAYIYTMFGIAQHDPDDDDVEEPEEGVVLGGGRSGVDYPRRLLICAVSSMVGLQLLAWAGPIWLRIVGILCVSLASNLGEMTFLQLSTLYPTNIALGAFSTGTGFSGLISALIYNIVTSVLQIDVSIVISCVGIVPLAILAVYFFLLPSGAKFAGKYRNKPKPDAKGESTRLLNRAQTRRFMVISELPIIDKLKLVNGLMFEFMIPLFATFFFIYVANQGLLVDIVFPVPIPESYVLYKVWRQIFTQLRSFYPAYQLVYMTGAFLGRSSINFVRLPAAAIWMYFPVLVSICFLLALSAEALSMNWEGDLFGLSIVLLIVFGGGLGEGIAYSSAYWRVSREDLPDSVENRYDQLAEKQAKERPELAYEEDEDAASPESQLREQLIATLAISDVWGILCASIVSSFLSPAVCRYQVAHGRDLCRQR